MVSKALVSVGLIVFNGEEHLSSALDSLTRQDYPNLEIIISDNASTDSTREICLDYAARDCRIIYRRCSYNIGQTANSDRVIELSSGEYFMWASDHDLWSPQFLSVASDVLDKRDDVVLAYPVTVLIDNQGEPQKTIRDPFSVEQDSPLARYLTIVWQLHWANMIYGLMRRSALGSDPIPRVWAPDHVVLARLALKGKIVQIPEPLYFRRDIRPQENFTQAHARLSYQLDPTLSDVRLEQSSADLYRGLRAAHLKLLLKDRMSLLEKCQGVVSTLRCFQVRFGVKSRVLEALARGSRILPGDLKSELTRVLGPP